MIGSEELFAAWFQLASRDMRGPCRLFDAAGRWRHGNPDAEARDSLFLEARRSARNVPFFRDRPDLLGLLEDRASFEAVVEEMAADAETFAARGRIAFRLRRDLPERTDLWYAGPAGRREEAVRAARSLRPVDLLFVGEGGYNTVHRLELPAGDPAAAFAVRSVKRHPRNVRPYGRQVETHNRLTAALDGLRADGRECAKAPRAFFADPLGLYMAMPYIPHARTLREAAGSLSSSDRERLLGILRRTLAAFRDLSDGRFYHRDLHGGNVLVTFDVRSGEAASLWIIDFDFSVFLPAGGGEDPRDAYTDILCGERFTYAPDGQALAYLEGP